MSSTAADIFSHVNMLREYALAMCGPREMSFQHSDETFVLVLSIVYVRAACAQHTRYRYIDLRVGGRGGPYDSLCIVNSDTNVFIILPATL